MSEDLGPVEPVDLPGELCDNGLDDKGDGQVDERCPCATGATQSCYPGTPAQDGVERCQRGT